MSAASDFSGAPFAASPGLPHDAPVRLSVNALAMRYGNGHEALAGIDLALRAGEMVAILGGNGSGKSTFMKCAVGLQRPTGGTVEIAGRNLAALSGRALREARLPVALIWQHAHLVGRRSVLANVCCGALGRQHGLVTALGGLPRGEIGAAMACLEEVGLAHLAGQRADTLSGGQAQRVAVARALMQRPHVLLADEPIASLDPEAAEDIMRLLRRLAVADGLAVACVLHQTELACRYAHRLVGLRRGRLAFDAPTAHVAAHDIGKLYQTENPA